MASESIFPDEIMIEILLRLPVKSILRCKTLSKHHYSLIHSQFFIRRHLSLGRLNDQSIISPIQDSVRLFDRRGHIEVLETSPTIFDESSNYYGDVVCDPVEGLYLVIDPMKDRFAVWNPSTREHFLLPPVPSAYDDYDTRICDRQCYAYGFGYDDITNDYKFVLIYDINLEISEDVDVVSQNIKSFNIFSVSKGEWRSIEEWSGVVPELINFCSGVFVHGACHWEYTSSGRPGFTILAFDMLTELNRFIALPTVGDEYAWSEAFIVSFSGCLGLVNAQKGGNMTGLSLSFDVWVMAEYGVLESWKILHRVMLPDGIGGRYLGIVRDRFYITKGDGCLVSYDLYSKDEERYDILDSDVGSLLSYEESLVRIIKPVY
ncbi:F-box/kelch-repeat protein At3g06240-like [Silene latifolia]|uniref:F-box/kelch-repeat protein At3g06240-like n=1 Tax=Silene latifolia TaxID=37657 RepID=UPI003D789960